jgi:hypothetical protein
LVVKQTGRMDGSSSAAAAAAAAPFSSSAARLLQRMGLGGADSRSHTTTDPTLPPEVTEQLGQYCKTLEELAASNPPAYEAFLRAQDEAAAALAEHTACVPACVRLDRWRESMPAAHSQHKSPLSSY